MFKSINEAFNKRKADILSRERLLESVLEVEEVMPGSEDEMDDVVDADSVPSDVYKKLDAELDKIVDDPDYDDSEIEEMIDDDDEVSDEEIEAIMDEACNAWYDCDGIGHPDTSKRSPEKHQALFYGSTSMVDKM